MLEIPSKVDPEPLSAQTVDHSVEIRAVGAVLTEHDEYSSIPAI